DSDARAQDGSHAFAHLWDNGKSAKDGLNEILKVRRIAITKFSENNIREGEPYSNLEDLLVLLFFMHRYQAEATVKLIGGMDYNYAKKGDGQLIVEDLDSSIQQNALLSILASISAQNLTIPRKILKLLPPRAYGYPKTRESFGGKTGVSFDPFSAASTATELVINLLLNPKRLNRIVIQNSLDQSKLSIDKVFDQLIKHTFHKKYSDSYLNEIQNQINVVVLIHILRLSTHKDAFSKTKYEAVIALKNIEDLSKKIKNKNNNFDQYLHIIKDFNKNPEIYQKSVSPKIPDGSPIGHFSCQ
ncbi:MAG: peptidase, partial [Flavobacteriales bacterium]|nr:peptidase [Flavobacteriales bacterium]